jgi:hypothetical protein
MLIYEYSPINNYFTGKVEQVADGSGIPMCWTDEAVPEIPAGMFARYNNPGWVLTDVEPPLPPDPPPPPAIKVTEPPVVI